MISRFIEDVLNFTGTLEVLRYHWFWIAVSAGLGGWVGWHIAGEPGEGAKMP